MVYLIAYDLKSEKGGIDDARFHQAMKRECCDSVRILKNTWLVEGNCSTESIYNRFVSITGNDKDDKVIVVQVKGPGILYDSLEQEATTWIIKKHRRIERMLVNIPSIAYGLPSVLAWLGSQKETQMIYLVAYDLADEKKESSDDSKDLTKAMKNKFPDSIPVVGTTWLVRDSTESTELALKSFVEIANTEGNRVVDEDIIDSPMGLKEDVNDWLQEKHLLAERIPTSKLDILEKKLGRKPWANG